MGQCRIHDDASQTPRIAEAHPKRTLFSRVLGVEHPAIKTLIVDTWPIRQPNDGFMISHHHSSGHTEVHPDGHAVGVDQHDFAVAAHPYDPGSCRGRSQRHRVGHHHSIGMTHGRDDPTLEVCQRTPVHFGLEHFRHSASVVGSCALHHAGGVLDTALTIAALMVGCLALWWALRLEPHWVSRSGDRFTARVQVLGIGNQTQGRWREVRAAITDDGDIVMRPRGIAGGHLRGRWRAVTAAVDPSGRRAVYLLQRSDPSAPPTSNRLVMRFPVTSRARAVVDALATSQQR